MKKIDVEKQIVNSLYKCNAYAYSCLGALGGYAEELSVEEIDISDALTAKNYLKQAFYGASGLDDGDIKDKARELAQKSFNRLNTFLNAFEDLLMKGYEEIDYMAEDFASAVDTSDLVEATDISAAIIDLFPEAKKQVEPFTLVKKY